jgi:hypothetical protein
MPKQIAGSELTPRISCKERKQRKETHVPEMVKIWEVVETPSEGATWQKNFGRYPNGDAALVRAMRLRLKGIACRIESVEVPAGDLEKFLGGQLRLYWWWVRCGSDRLRTWWWGLQWT